MWHNKHLNNHWGWSIQRIFITTCDTWMFMCSVLSYGQLNPTFVFYYYTVIHKNTIMCASKVTFNNNPHNKASVLKPNLKKKTFWECWSPIGIKRDLWLAFCAFNFSDERTFIVLPIRLTSSASTEKNEQHKTCKTS